jgi:adenosine deaminase
MVDLGHHATEPDSDSYAKERAITSRIADLLKGELHVHLNGLVSPRLVRSILREEGAEIPEGFDLDKDMTRTSPCSSLREYLKPWQVLRRIPSNPHNLLRITDDAFQRLQQNNVRFVEVRSSVLYLRSLRQCSHAESLRLLIEATRSSAARYEITCGLILTVTRGDYSTIQLGELLAAYRDLGCPSDVVGLDLAGDEETSIPTDLHAHFRDAKEKYGFGITVHAGETGRIENVLEAIEKFSADRIGHATAAGGHPTVMDTIARKNICIEVCPISNRLTGAVRQVDSHPLREFEKQGVPFVLCSDNPGIHERGLNADFAAASTELTSPSLLQRQFEVARKFSFLRLTS